MGREKRRSAALLPRSYPRLTFIGEAGLTTPSFRWQHPSGEIYGLT